MRDKVRVASFGDPADPNAGQGFLLTHGADAMRAYQGASADLQSIANDRAIDPRGLAWWDKLAHAARTNAPMVGLGFRLSTMVIHGMSAALNSLGEAGARPMLQAVGSFMRDPKGMRDLVFERSGEMRNRMNEVDRDMRDVLREMGDDHGKLATVHRFSMQGVAMLDMASAMPTWVAGYTEALCAGLDDADAVYRADQLVRNAHGAGEAKDTAALQRGSETQKLFTMFIRSGTTFITGSATCSGTRGRSRTWATSAACWRGRSST